MNYDWVGVMNFTVVAIDGAYGSQSTARSLAVVLPQPLVEPVLC